MAKTAYSLDQYKTDAQKQLEQKRQNARQAADISYQKLQKYLPHQMAGKSVGMTESAQIAANSAYQKALAQADSEYATGMTDLQNYVRTEKKAEQDAAYNELMTSIEAGEFNTTDQLEEYVRSAKGRVSDEQMAALERKLSYYKSAPEQIAADESFRASYAPVKDEKGNITGYEKNPNAAIKSTVRFDKNVGGDSWKQGDNIRLTDGTTEYDVQVGGNAITAGSKAYSDLKKYAEAAGVGENDIFSSGGQIYLYKDGKYYKLEQRTGSREEDWSALLELYK